jgi:hypothetical protein
MLLYILGGLTLCILIVFKTIQSDAADIFILIVTVVLGLCFLVGCIMRCIRKYKEFKVKRQVIPRLESTHIIPTLEPLRFKKNTSFKETECSICFDNKKSRKLPCGHEFCDMCPNGFKNKCPLCRKEYIFVYNIL